MIYLYFVDVRFSLSKIRLDMPKAEGREQYRDQAEHDLQYGHRHQQHDLRQANLILVCNDLPVFCCLSQHSHKDKAETGPEENFKITPIAHSLLRQFSCS